MTIEKKIVQFGAGNIGRSLVGQLFSKAGYEVVFVEAVPEIVERLNEKRRYLVRVKDEYEQDIWVDNARALPASEIERIADEIATAAVVGTAVGPNALPRIYEALAAGLERRTEPVSVIMCENLLDVAASARAGCLEHLPPGFDLEARAGFVATSIGKMVPIMPERVRREDPLEVWAEAYNKIVADADAFVGSPIEIDGLVKRRCFAAYVDRKLFIHNLGHAVCAYHGFLAGKRTIWESMAVGQIEKATRGAMWESGRALIAKYPQVFDEANQEQEIEDLLRRFRNRALGDTVYRVGRDLKRKLGPQDRFVGALRCDFAFGVELAETLAGFMAALRFAGAGEDNAMFPGDVEFHRLLKANGLPTVLDTICALSLETDSPIRDRILDLWHRGGP